MELKDFTNFVEGAKAVIEVQQHTIKQLSKMASNEQPEVKQAPAIDRQLLLKAASAVHTLKGSPSAISVETIADAWTENPGTMADTIIKLASEQAESIVSGSHMVRTIKKTSSADTKNAPESADAGFWSRRENR